MRNIILTGGGTAGHIIPNLALVHELKKHFDNIYYIGSENPIDRRLVEEYGIPFFSTTTVKLHRDKIFENLKIPFLLKKGIREAEILLKKLNPSVVFSKGGFVSLPTVFASSKRKIPTIVHESDISIGLANRLAIKKANNYITSFETTALGKKGIYIGQPIRDKIFCGRKINLLQNSKPILLVIGGSQGAKAINQLIVNNIEKIKDYNIIHITGKGKKLDNVAYENYTQIEYASNIEDYLAVADVIISRCGAGAAFEIMALNKKVIFIPLQSKSTRGDQCENAKYFSRFSGVEIINESDANSNSLIDALNRLQSKSASNFIYDRETNAKIVEIILKNAKKN